MRTWMVLCRVWKLRNVKCLDEVGALANLLKPPEHRQQVWTTNGGFARHEVEGVTGEHSQMLYTCVFVCWVLVCEGSALYTRNVDGKVVSQPKEFPSVDVKVEKVVRLALLVIEDPSGCDPFVGTIAPRTFWSPFRLWSIIS